VRLQVDDHFGNPIFLAQRPQSGNQSILAECHLLAQGDRRGFVVDAEDFKCHWNASTGRWGILVDHAGNRVLISL
jgi:hypothetical protein